MTMLTDNVDAGAFMGDRAGGINYYINNLRVTREEFHTFRAEHEITDFRAGDSEFPCKDDHERVFVGHWRSFINACTQEAMRLNELLHIDAGFNRCCLMTLRDRYWTIEQHNYVYHRVEEFKFMALHCHDCPLTQHCNKDLADVRVCLDDDHRREQNAEYGRWLHKELYDDDGFLK